MNKTALLGMGVSVSGSAEGKGNNRTIKLYSNA
jgi:hypothetical protein